MKGLNFNKKLKCLQIKLLFFRNRNNSKYKSTANTMQQVENAYKIVVMTYSSD